MRVPGLDFMTSDGFRRKLHYAFEHHDHFSEKKYRFKEVSSQFPVSLINNT